MILTEENKIKIITSATKSAIITVVFIAIITMAADLAPSLKGWLASTFSHHWIGKSILSLALFFIFSALIFFCPCQKNIEKATRLLSYLFISSIASVIIIFLFFVWEAFLK